MITQSDLQRGVDNTDLWSRSKGESGLLFLWKKMWPHVFTSPFAQVHWEMLQTILTMYDPQYTTKMDRQRYCVVHRECGKTTMLTFAWPSTCLWLQGYSFFVRRDALGWEGADVHDYEIIQLPPLREKLILINSETATRAEQFVSNLKSDIESNRYLMGVFGDLRPKKVFVDDQDDLAITGRSGDVLWRKTAFITHNERFGDKTIIVGIGSGQQTRGININNTRPTLILSDDLYSLKNIKTAQTRENLSYWFDSELGNTTDTLAGKQLLAGTVLHPGTVTYEVQDRRSWRGITKSVIGLVELESVVEKCRRDNTGIIEIPNEETTTRWQQSLKTLSWPERFTLRYILQKYQQSQEKGKLREFYQEFCNIPHAPEEVKFQWRQFVPVRTQHDRLQGQEVLSWEFEGRRWYGKPVWYYGIDLASADSVKADELVMCSVAMMEAVTDVDSRGERLKRTFPYIGFISGGRGYDVLKTAGSRRRSIMGELEGQLRIRPARYVTVDAHATQELTVRTIEGELRKLGERCIVDHHTHGGSKDDFILSVLEPLIQRYGLFLYNESYMDLMRKTYDQLVSLGSDDHDDFPDGLAMAFLHAMVSSSPSIEVIRFASKGSTVPRFPGEESRFSPTELWETI